MENMGSSSKKGKDWLLTSYMNEVRKLPRLSKEEEKRLLETLRDSSDPQEQAKAEKQPGYKVRLSRPGDLIPGPYYFL